MQKPLIFICLFLLGFSFITCTEKKGASSPPSFQTHWPDSLEWWKRNNLRVMQANLPAYESGIECGFVGG